MKIGFVLLSIINVSLYATPKLDLSATSHDFGKVKRFEKPKHIFTIKNTGTSDLKILKVKGSCGCTVPKLKDNIIPAGKSTTITVSFNPQKQKGKVTKTVTIYNNATKITEIKIFAEIVEMYEVIPKRVDFGKVKIGGEAKFKFMIKPLGGIDIKRLYFNEKEFKIAYTRADPKDNMSLISFAGVYKPLKGSVPKRVSNVIRVVVGKSTQERILVPVIGEIIGDIEVKPKNIFMSRLEIGKDVKTTFRIADRNKKAFKITGIKTTNGNVIAKVIKDGGFEYVVEVTVKGNHGMKYIGGMINVHLDRADMKRVVLRFQFRYRRRVGKK